MVLQTSRHTSIQEFTPTPTEATSLTRRLQQNPSQCAPGLSPCLPWITPLQPTTPVSARTLTRHLSSIQSTTILPFDRSIDPSIFSACHSLSSVNCPLSTASFIRLSCSSVHPSVCPSIRLFHLHIYCLIEKATSGVYVTKVDTVHLATFKALKNNTTIISSNVYPQLKHLLVIGSKLILVSCHVVL